MNQVITGVPFTDEEVRVYMDTSDGTMQMDKGALDDARGDDHDRLGDGPQAVRRPGPGAGMQAFMAGKIKVEGDMTKLMMMNATQPDETAKAVAAEIKEITA